MKFSLGNLTVNQLTAIDETAEGWLRLLIAIVTGASVDETNFLFDGTEKKKYSQEEMMEMFANAKTNNISFREIERELQISHSYGCALRKKAREKAVYGL